jgi:hypothetical protein
MVVGDATLEVNRAGSLFAMDLARSKGDRQPDGRVAHNQKLLNTFGADIEILATRDLREEP